MIDVTIMSRTPQEDDVCQSCENATEKVLCITTIKSNGRLRPETSYFVRLCQGCLNKFHVLVGLTR